MFYIYGKGDFINAAYFPKRRDKTIEDVLIKEALIVNTVK